MKRLAHYHVPLLTGAVIVLLAVVIISTPVPAQVQQPEGPECFSSQACQQVCAADQ